MGRSQNLRFTDASEKLRTRSVRSFLDPCWGKKERKRDHKSQYGQKPEARGGRCRGVRLAGMGFMGGTRGVVVEEDDQGRGGIIGGDGGGRNRKRER